MMMKIHNRRSWGPHSTAFTRVGLIGERLPFLFLDVHGASSGHVYIHLCGWLMNAEGVLPY